MDRDLVAIMDDIPAGSFGLDVTITLPSDVRAELDRSDELRELAARSQAQAAQLAVGARPRLTHGKTGKLGPRSVAGRGGS